MSVFNAGLEFILLTRVLNREGVKKHFFKPESAAQSAIFRAKNGCIGILLKKATRGCSKITRVPDPSQSRGGMEIDGSGRLITIYRNDQSRGTR
jgi:hypothetical protein